MTLESKYNLILEQSGNQQIPRVRIDSQGTKEWYIDSEVNPEDNVLHRLDGPAVEFRDGCEEWWVNGKVHRLDGPAITKSDGTKEWWINGKRITEEEFEAYKSLFKTSKELGVDLDI